MKKQMIAILGTEFTVPEDASLFRLADKVAHLPETEKPRVLVTCGDKDFLLEDNRRFDEHMRKLSTPYTYKEWGGGHDWKFWEESLPVMFEFFGEEV